MALQDLFEKNPVLLSSIAVFDETIVLDCYKGEPVPESASRKARKHGAIAAKRRIFNLNTVNSLHSFIKEMYNHYRSVATELAPWNRDVKKACSGAME